MISNEDPCFIFTALRDIQLPSQLNGFLNNNNNALIEKKYKENTHTNIYNL